MAAPPASATPARCRKTISQAIKDNDLVACSVLSGNRNFEGRVNPDVKANYLASPPLVVAYALAGTMNINLTTDPLGHTPKGEPVYLKDIWPDTKEVAEFVRKNVTRKAYQARYKDVFKGDAQWRKIKVDGGMTYNWDEASTYVQNPPYFDGMKMEPEPVEDIQDARILRPVPRLDHHRPHLACRRDQGGKPGWRVSHQAPDPSA
jgi:aconitate hydratase